MNRRKFINGIGVASLVGVIGGVSSVYASVVNDVPQSKTVMRIDNMNIRAILLEIRDNLNDDRYIRAFNTMSQFEIVGHYAFITREIYQPTCGKHINIYPKDNFKSRWMDSVDYNEKVGAHIVIHDKKNHKKYLVTQKIIMESNFEDEHSGFSIICQSGTTHFLDKSVPDVVMRLQ